MKRNVSLAEFNQIQNDPIHRNMVRRALAQTYEEFVEVLYDDLDFALSGLELNPQFHQKSDEDSISQFIIQGIRGFYRVTQGATGGGNKDITVEGRERSWMWIGEAKIYKSVTDLREGWLQLTTRYKHADPQKNAAALLAYTFRPDAVKQLCTWRTSLRKQKVAGYQEASCARRKSLAFYSTHKHQDSGCPMRVRHIAINLSFGPKDKSARKSKKHSTA